MHPQLSISIPAKPEIKLKLSSQLSISIPPLHPKLDFSKTTFIDICPAQPKQSYHPYVIEAMQLMYSKAPDELTAEEWDQFRAYYEWKKSKGEPIEEDIV